MPLNTRTIPGGSTRLVGLIGDGIRLSYSFHLHNTVFAELGMDWVYLPIHVNARPQEELEAALRGLRALGFVGANVTMPFKSTVLEHLDLLQGDALPIGAVNALRIEPDGRFLGINTDAPGFTADMKHHGVVCRDRPAIVLGAGGAARAVTYALLQAGCSDLAISNRTSERAQELVSHLGRLFPGARIRSTTWMDGLPSCVKPASIIVNCTSVGMAGTPTSHQLPWPADLGFQQGHVVVDLVYRPELTPFLARAQADGVALAMGGRGMLYRQAALSFAWWTGRSSPMAQMRRAMDSITPSLEGEHALEREHTSLTAPDTSSQPPGGMLHDSSDGFSPVQQESEQRGATQLPAGPRAGLPALRKGIDDLDRRILQLLAGRMGLVSAIGRIKSTQGLDVHDPRREDAVRERWAQIARSQRLPRDLAMKLLDLLLGASRSLQLNTKEGPASRDSAAGVGS